MEHSTTEYGVFSSNQAKLTDNSNPTESDNVRYSLVGIDENGVEEYVTSEDVLNVPWKSRMEMFLNKMENEYRGRTARFNKNGDIFYALFEKDDVRKNIYGDNQSSRKGLNAKINEGADGSIFDLVENSKYLGSKKEVGKKNISHKDVLSWDYFIKTVKINGVVFDLIANVRQKADASFVYNLKLNEKEDSLRAGETALGSSESSKENVSKSSEKVNDRSSIEMDDYISEGTVDYMTAEQETVYRTTRKVV